MNSEVLVRVPEAAHRLGVSVHTVRHWVREQKIPFVRLSRVIRFSPRALQQFIDHKAVLPLNCHED